MHSVLARDTSEMLPWLPCLVRGAALVALMVVVTHFGLP